jgi:hypothetical protein
MEERRDGWMAGWLDGWMDGWMDGCVARQGFNEQLGLTASQSQKLVVERDVVLAEVKGAKGKRRLR